MIAKRVPGRTDSQVKNYWNTHLRKKVGIREQTRRVGDSSLTQSRKVDVSGSAAETSASNNTSATNTENLEDKSIQNAVNNISAAKEFNIDEGFMNSLWDPDHDDLGLGTFTMMGFMDGNSLI